MALELHGIVKGKQIELERETGLPLGSAVVVRVEPKRLTLEEKRRLVDVVLGSWGGDKSLKTIFSEIEKLRAIAPPREVNFDAAS
ncbi:MAG TPA: hypothetical protein PKK96_02090 [Anaerolineales bacterium]|nr:hypothetical protein [Anaerolineales bacterium]HMR99549.1 hypothetical protein [Anaerolineales bacterium]HNQ94714.1 hypothetical protein [Anaerolineales bacterium]HNS59770.1 hypothetical protein [Anaerolineales bacterium]